MQSILSDYLKIVSKTKFYPRHEISATRQFHVIRRTTNQPEVENQLECVTQDEGSQIEGKMQGCGQTQAREGALGIRGIEPTIAAAPEHDQPARQGLDNSSNLELLAHEICLSRR